ncbi:hypothetical protein CDAR_578791 [Caerostris darwini]|uniref:Uncharacterized protein n=1 Tax=Caerostris darwini TaxID=1538125 RepID=A0AAV4UC13_9ARAC|nr:hypothetical protein CDAR_578791 [Caerostris darwini]
MKIIVQNLCTSHLVRNDSPLRSVAAFDSESLVAISLRHPRKPSSSHKRSPQDKVPTTPSFLHTHINKAQIPVFFLSDILTTVSGDSFRQTLPLMYSYRNPLNSISAALNTSQIEGRGGDKE